MLTRTSRQCVSVVTEPLTGIRIENTDQRLLPEWMKPLVCFLTYKGNA